MFSNCVLIKDKDSTKALSISPQFQMIPSPALVLAGFAFTNKTLLVCEQGVRQREQKALKNNNIKINQWKEFENHAVPMLHNHMYIVRVARATSFTTSGQTVFVCARVHV